MKTCQLACMGMDVIRGKLGPSSISPALTSNMLKRLEFTAAILQRDTRNDDPLHRRIPVMPRHMFATVVDPVCFDACVGMTIGRDNHRASVVIRQEGSRWICTMLDVG